jgi:predicted AlkP superfamily pyrophosphatase or phosphodiesterase
MASLVADAAVAIIPSRPAVVTQEFRTMLQRCFRFVPGVALALVAMLSPFAPAAPGERDSPAKPEKVSLAVLVIFDQFPNEFLTRPWAEHFQPVRDGKGGGFRRLMENGAWFQNCYYPYANTVTGAGHASVATGCSPGVHGIVGNGWREYRDASGKGTYCVEDTEDRAGRVPPAPKKADRKGAETSEAPPPGRSPRLLLAETVADALMKATNNTSRVVSLSLKDRSAILPGGHNERAACYWFDSADGNFVTSNYYRDSPHDFVRDFNGDKEKFADQWRGKRWERREGLNYERLGVETSTAGKGTGADRLHGQAFPHPFGDEATPAATYYRRVETSPAGNELLLELARRAVAGLDLGRNKDGVPDLLCVSFSSNDLVGHAWGPDSPEVLDVTLSSDVIVRRLLDYLDKQVPGRYLLVLTADHAICPLPEVAQKKGHFALRIDAKKFVREANDFVTKQFCDDAAGRYVEAAFPWFYLNHERLRASGASPSRVTRGLAAWLEAQPGVWRTYTRAELGSGDKLDRVGEMMRRSFHAGRCGDVGVVTKPYCFFYEQGAGTTHGSPHDYDTHVPLLAYGPGVKAGVRYDPVRPQTAAAILAHGLGINAPDRCDARVPAGLFEKQ